MTKGFPKKIFVLLIILFLFGISVFVSAGSNENENIKESEDNNTVNLQTNENNPYKRARVLSNFNIDRINLFGNINLRSFNIFTKWVDSNGMVFEKTTPVSSNNGLIDVNDDGINDVKIVFDFGLRFIEVEDSDFSSLSFPYVLGFVTSVETIRMTDGCVDDLDFFEIHFQVGFPSFLGLEEKVFHIGGFRSLIGETTPNSFKTTHRFIPYFIRNLFGLNKSPEFWVSQNPGDINKDSIDYLIGVNEVDGPGESTVMVVENKPAKSFNLKFKLGLNEDSRFKLDSKEGMFDNLIFSLIRERNDKRIGGSFVFNNLERVDFDASLDISNNKASVSYYSRNNLDFDFLFFNELEESLFNTSVSWAQGKSFTAEMIKDLGFSVKSNHVFELKDLSYTNPKCDINLGLLSSQRSGSFGVSLDNAGLSINSDIKLDLSNLGFKNDNFSIDINTVKPSIAGLFSIGLDSDSRGFKIGGDIGVFVEDVFFKSLKKDINIDVSGGIEVESGGWLNLYKNSDDVNNLELKLMSLSFEFDDIDLSYNNEHLNIHGLFDFGNKQERVFNVQWKKLEVFKLEFDKDVALTVSDFYIGTNTGNLVDHLKINDFSWNNGRSFVVDASEDGLLLETSTNLGLNDLSMVFKNGAKLSSDNAFFEGAFEVEWFEEKLFLDVESYVDWDLKVDTPVFGVWNMNGLLEGNVGVNSEWEKDNSGTLEFIAGSNGVIHNFFIEHESLELHFGTVDITPGNILFEWKRGTDGYLELNNNGITASLGFCNMIHPPSSFSFEVGSISLTPGDTKVSWVNDMNLIQLNLDSMITFDVDLIKLSLEEAILRVTSLGIKPGVFDFKWYRNDNKMEMSNSISGFGPTVSLEKNNEIFKASIIELSNLGRTFSLEWFKDDDSITGFLIDTNGYKSAEWIECSYRFGDNYGRKLSLTGLRANDFSINNQDSTLNIGGRIGGSGFVFSDYRNNDWHMLSDSIWDVDGDGDGFFSMECDPDWNIDISSLVLLSNLDITINNGIIYAPSYFNLTWEFGLNPARVFIGLDTDGETIGNIDLDIEDSWWRIVIDGSTIATEDFWIYWEIWQGIQTGGTIYPGSDLNIEIYIQGTKVFWYTYP